MLGLPSRTSCIPTLGSNIEQHHKLMADSGIAHESASWQGRTPIWVSPTVFARHGVDWSTIASRSSRHARTRAE